MDGDNLLRGAAATKVTDGVTFIFVKDDIAAVELQVEAQGGEQGADPTLTQGGDI